MHKLDPTSDSDLSDTASLLSCSQSFDGANISYEIVGDDASPCLVICHGMGLDNREFREIAIKLSRNWRVLLWDMPGHGQSGAIGGVVSVQRITDVLEAILVSAKVESAVFLGFSFGGVVAQSLARRSPSRVAGMVVYGALAPFHQPAPVPRWLAGFVTWGMFGRKPWPTICIEFARACSETSGGQAIVLKALSKTNKSVFVAMASALLRSFEKDPGFLIPVPLLRLRGEKDSNGPLLDIGSAALGRANPNSEEIIIPEAGHCAHLDRPEAFEAVIEGFLSRNWPRNA